MHGPIFDPLRGFLGLDFESYSEFDIDFGAAAYSEHPSTKIYCASFGYWEPPEPGAPPTMLYPVDWIPGMPVPASAVDFIKGGGSVVAHNAAMERAMIKNIAAPLHGFPTPAPEQWVDTQALGNYFNLPANLEQLCVALNVPTPKDREGHKLMMKMAKPRNVGGVLRPPVVTQAMLMRLIAYCRVDVIAMMQCLAVLRGLGGMTLDEVQLERVHNAINARGVRLDEPFGEAMRALLSQRVTQLNESAARITGGVLQSSKATQTRTSWVKSRGITLPLRKRKQDDGTFKWTESLDGDAVEEILEREGVPPDVQQLLKEGQESNKATSLAKLARVDSMTCADGRFYDAFKFHEAHTGRWSSGGIQLHNIRKFFSRKTPEDRAHVKAVIDAIWRRDMFALQMLVPNVLDALSKAMRNVVIAHPGYVLTAADFSAIEARVLAWLAGEYEVLQIFKDGRDIYMEDAAKVGSTDRNLGKIQRLGLGFGMSALTCSEQNDLERKLAFRVVRTWRENNPNIVGFWQEIEDQFKEAIRKPNVEVGVGPLLVAQSDGNVLRLRLPSGRCLHYWQPRIVKATKKVRVLREDGTVETKEWESDTIRFKTKKKGRMMDEDTYSGKLTENVTQATARELMGAALTRIDKFRYRRTDEPVYPLVAHVHDSACAENQGEGSVEEFSGVMAELPTWALGLPNECDGYRAKAWLG